MFDFLTNKIKREEIENIARIKRQAEHALDQKFVDLLKQFEAKAAKMFKVNEKVKYMGADFWVSGFEVEYPCFYRAECRLEAIEQLDIKRNVKFTIEMFSRGVHHKLKVSPNKLIKIKEGK